ncbi:MAG TPA: hypothetical protein VNO52_00695, partial [Methylomirabilota bacterium]|nr:hypothetical protein [Methylomirabilota bacterium]
MKPAWLLFPLALHLCDPLVGRLAGAESLLPPGFRPRPPGVHALAGATVVPRPGETLSNATIVVRNGYIEAVGPAVTPPADARVWDLRGVTIYAGFIEPYWPAASNAPAAPAAGATVSASPRGGVDFYGVPAQRGEKGPRYEVARVTPEFRAARRYAPEAKALEAL